MFHRWSDLLFHEKKRIKKIIDVYNILKNNVSLHVE